LFEKFRENSRKGDLSNDTTDTLLFSHWSIPLFTKKTGFCPISSDFGSKQKIFEILIFYPT
jgi:hypothetical protein